MAHGIAHGPAYGPAHVPAPPPASAWATPYQSNVDLDDIEMSNVEGVGDDRGDEEFFRYLHELRDHGRDDHGSGDEPNTLDDGRWMMILRRKKLNPQH